MKIISKKAENGTEKPIEKKIDYDFDLRMSFLLFYYCKN